MKNKVDSMSKIGGYASYNVGFQKNIYEKAKAKKLKEQQENRVKRSVVRGNTADELIKNIQAVNWDKVAEEVRPKAGGKIDLGV